MEVIAEEEEGWFRGRLNNKEGVFPSNFVESTPVPAEPTPPPAAPEPGQNLTLHARTHTHTHTHTLYHGWFCIFAVLKSIFTYTLLIYWITYVIHLSIVRPEEPVAPKQPPMGHKLFPSINPALARAQLKSSVSSQVHVMCSSRIC